MEKAVKTDMEYREILEKSLSAIQYLRIHGFSTYMESEGIVNRIMMFKDSCTFPYTQHTPTFTTTY